MNRAVSRILSGLDLAIEPIGLERCTKAIRSRAVACDGQKTVDSADIDGAFLDPIAHSVERIGATTNDVPTLLGTLTRAVSGKRDTNAARIGSRRL